MLLFAKPTEASLHLVLLALLAGNAGTTTAYCWSLLGVLVALAIASDQLHWRWLTGIDHLLRRTPSPGICHGLVALPMLMQALATHTNATGGGHQLTSLLLRACTFSSFSVLLALCLLQLTSPTPRHASTLQPRHPNSQPPPPPASHTNGTTTTNTSASTNASCTSNTAKTHSRPHHKLAAFHPAYILALATIPCLLALCQHPSPPPSTAHPPTHLPHHLPALLAFTALHLTLLTTLLRRLPRSFTLCEATLVSQAAACTTTLFLHTITATTHAPTLHHLLLHRPLPPHPTPSTTLQPALVPTFTILLCSLVLLACGSIAVLVHHLHPPHPHPKHTPPTTPTHPAPRRTPTLTPLTALAALTLTTSIIAMASLAAWVLQWLAAGPPVRLLLLQYWVAVLAGGLPLMVALLRGGRCPHIVVRKGYHLLAVALFLPAAVLDLPMLAVSLAIAFALLAALEVLRAARVGPLGRAIDSFMSGFTDARDAGPLYLTHFTLLLGMAAPVWLAAGTWPQGTPDGSQTQQPALPLVPALAGVMSLGLGDTAASAVGYLWGRHRLFHCSSKTWEGTGAGFAATLAGWLALWAAGMLRVHGQGWVGVVACSAAASMLEAATTQLDNLFVPLYFVAALVTVLPAGV